jgi:hypothetical protein
MTEFHKKLRHLSTTMIQWAEENKIRAKNGKFEIPLRSNVEWKEDFKFVTKLDSMLADGLDVKLNRAEMKMCNQLYKYYGSVYVKI